MAASGDVALAVAAQPEVAAEPAVAENMVPVCSANQEQKFGKWQAVSVQPATVVIQGGFAGRAQHVAQTLACRMGVTEWRFAHICKTARWFLFAVAGPRAMKNDLYGVEVLDLTRRKFSGTSAPAEADDAAVAEDGDDPMNALDEIATPARGQKKTSTNKQRRACGVPVEITMPKRPPCSGVDQDQVQAIYVLLKPGGNRQLCIRMDCVDWLVAYAADEHAFQGIVRADPLPILAPAVADYRVEWDFNEHFWVASILAGPGLGRTKRFDPETLRLQQWKGLEELSLVEGFLSKSSIYTRKNAAKELAKLWCLAALNNEKQKFEDIWIHPPQLPPCGEEPQEKRQRRFEELHPPAVAVKTEPSAVAAPQPAVPAPTINPEPAAVAEGRVNIEPPEVAPRTPAVVDNTVIDLYNSDGA